MIKIELYDADERYSIFSLYFDVMPTQDQFMIALCRHQGLDVDLDEYVDKMLEFFKSNRLPEPVNYWESCDGVYITDNRYDYTLYVQRVNFNRVEDCK